MSKLKQRFATAENQLSLFDILTKEQATSSAPPAEGSANIHERLRLSMRDCLSHPTKSRWQIAGDMSHLLGVEITKSMLDGWVAESKEHRIPAEYLPAFCRAAECSEPVRILAEASGAFLMKSEEALRAEIQKWDEQVKKAQAEKKRRTILLATYAQGQKP